jgi:predicted metal-binding protein
MRKGRARIAARPSGLCKPGFSMSFDTPSTSPSAALPSTTREASPESLPKGPVIVTVCTSCRQAGIARDEAPGRHFFEALRERASGEGVVIRPTQCLSVCKRICTISLSAEGGYTYVFGDLDPASDVADVLAMAEKVAAAEHGFVPWQARPEAMKRGLLARVPPPHWSPEDGSAPA